MVLAVAPHSEFVVDCETLLCVLFHFVPLDLLLLKVTSACNIHCFDDVTVASLLLI
jgi:hypothetical protein